MMSKSKPLRYRTLRALGFLASVILGFRCASPQALCFHPLRGLWKSKPTSTCAPRATNNPRSLRRVLFSTLTLIYVIAFVISAHAQEPIPTAPQIDPAKKANARPVETTVQPPEPFDGASIEKMAAQCVSLETELGVIEIEMIPEAAPGSVRGFLNLAATGALDTTTFSRVVRAFVIQGGDLSTSEKWGYDLAKRMSRKLPDEPSVVKHVRGIVSMARPEQANSASTHFFILVGDGHHLDGKFAAFGRVTRGIEVADAINKAPAEDEKPAKPVRIKRAFVSPCQK
jgi:peptidyl-prolyl cis-trans isomerase B (cyclophilin B)